MVRFLRFVCNIALLHLVTHPSALPNAWADPGVLQSFQACATDVADSADQNELIKVTGQTCPTGNQPLNKTQESIVKSSLQITQSKDWPRTVKKIAVVYDRFLNERATALKRSDEELKRLEKEDSDQTAKALTETFTRFNQLCAKFGKIEKESSGKASELRERHKALAAEALRQMIEGDRTIKLFMSTETMLAHTRTLHDGNLGFQHCAEGKSLFSTVSGVGKNLIPGSSVRLMRKELRERWEKEQTKIKDGRDLVAKHKFFIEAEEKKNVAGNPAIGAMRWINSVNGAMGSELADYPEAVATMLTDPRTKDPAVASILCSALHESNVRKTQIMVVKTVGAIGVGLLTGGAGTALGMTATGIALAETGLGAIYSLITVQIQQSNSRARLAGSNMLGLLTDESMDNILTDELVEGYKSIAMDLAFFGAGKGLGKVLSKVGTAAEVRFVRYLAKQKGLGEDEIEALVVALKNSTTGEKAQLAKEIFEAAKNKDGARMEKALAKFRNAEKPVEPARAVANAADKPKPEAPAKPSTGIKPEQSAGEVEWSSSKTIQDAATLGTAEERRIKKAVLDDFTKAYGGSEKVPLDVVHLMDDVHTTATFTVNEAGKRILRMEKGRKIALLKVRMRQDIKPREKADKLIRQMLDSKVLGVDDAALQYAGGPQPVGSFFSDAYRARLKEQELEELWDGMAPSADDIELLNKMKIDPDSQLAGFYLPGLPQFRNAVEVVRENPKFMETVIKSESKLFHGTNSSTLLSFTEHGPKRLMPSGQLLESGGVPFTGELRHGSVIGGMVGRGANVDNLSTNSIAGITNSNSVYTNFGGWNPEKSKELRKTIATDYSEEVRNLKNAVEDKRLAQWEKLNPEEQSLVSEGFPVIFGIRESKKAVYEPAQRAEIKVRDGVGVEDIGIVYVPADKIEKVKKIFESQGRNITVSDIAVVPK